MRTFFVVVVSCVVAAVFADEGTFDYRPSSQWPGACAKGKMQSPINIERKKVERADKKDGRVRFNTTGSLSEYTVVFTGVSLEIQFEKWTVEPNLRIPANEYHIGKSKKVKKGDMLAVEPLQMHYHTLSEHTFDGSYAPGEIHIVTKVKKGESDHCDKSGGCLAVFGIMTTFEGQGDVSRQTLSDIFSTEPEGVGPDNGVLQLRLLHLDDLLPVKRNYYTYLGSLTTPPCSESVTWHVFTDPIPIRPESIEKHQYMVSYTVGDDCTFSFAGTCVPPREKTNYRPIQPRNGRKVRIVRYPTPKVAQPNDSP